MSYNGNFSNYELQCTKQIMYNNIVDIIDVVTKIYNSTYDVFSFLKQLEFEQLDNKQSSSCWETLTRIKENRDTIDANLNEFVVVLDSYLKLEDEIDGYCSHQLDEICDEMCLIEENIKSL